MKILVLLPKSSRLGFLLAAVLSPWLAPGCKGSGVVGTVGVPNVEFGGSGISAQVNAVTPNPCEIDLDFGNLPIGQTEVASVRIKNAGAGSLDLLPGNPELDPEFGLTLPNPTSAESGSFLEMTVTFQPYQPGQVSSTLALQTDGLNPTCPTPGLVKVSMTGIGIKLSLLVQPSTVDFGNTVINTAAKKSITLSNESDAPIDDITAIPTGGDSNFFTVLDVPTSLDAHSQATVEISFEPLAVETRSIANILFQGAGGERTTLGLFGEPLGKALSLPATPINFGYVTLQSTVIACTTVTNDANVAVTIKGLTNFATAGNSFALATTDDAAPSPNPFSLPITLQSGVSTKVCFSFTPPVTQQYQGQATLVTDDPSGTNPVVKFTGWGGGPQITCTPASAGFGQTLERSVSTLSVVCTNTGTPIPGVKLQVNPPKASPYVFTAEFDATNNPYSTGGLAPGQSVQVDVNYAPTSASNDQGTLFIESNGGQGKTLEIPLSGQGLNVPSCQFVLSPPALDFANVQVGNVSTALSFEIDNVGPDICLLQGLAIKNDPTKSFHILSTSIPLDPTTGKIIIPAASTGLSSKLLVSLDFAPTMQSQGFSAEAAFSISDLSAPNQVVPLGGTSEPTCLVVAPTILDFGEVGENSAGVMCGSGSRTFRVFNQCQTAAMIQSITLQSGPSDTVVQFSAPLGPLLPVTLSGEAPQVYEMFFDPSTLGAHTGQILISDGTVETMLPVLGVAVSDSTETDTFVVAPPKADILWIMDVEEDQREQQVISNQLPAFFAAGAGIDYRMALTTDNDGSTSPVAEFGRLLPCPNCSLAGQTPTIVSPSSTPAGGTTPDPEAVFSALWTSVNANNYYGAGEHFFLALYNALQHGPQLGVDFFRPGVFFASISDDDYNEPDFSSEGAGHHDPSWYVNYFETYFQNPFLFTWNFISPTQPINGTGYSTSLSANIQKMISATSGLALNSQDSNWGAAFSSVWIPAIATHTNYPLTGSPSEGQVGIVVNVDGTKVDALAGPNNPNWTYQATLNAIVFNPASQPAIGSTISVTYPIGCN